MPLPQLLICDQFSSQAQGLLTSSGALQLQRACGLQPSSEELRETEYLIVRSRTLVNRQLLDQAPRLRLVVTCTSGFDHIDLKLCQERGVQVAYTPESNVQAVAELTLSLMVQLLRRLPRAQKVVEGFEWRSALPRGQCLKGKELGLVGLGRIGSRVAELARAYQMKLWAYDPYVSNEHFEGLGVERLGLSELLRQADIVSLHVPLTKETRHLINNHTLSAINPEAFLINTARGALVDENDLADALGRGLLQGVALDVFAKEPLPKDSKLRTFDRLVLTPHMGAYCEEAFQDASMEAARSLLHFVESGQAHNPLPPQAPWAEQLLSPSC